MILFFCVSLFAIGCSIGIAFYPFFPINIIVFILLASIFCSFFYKKTSRLICVFILFFLFGFIFSHAKLFEETKWSLPSNQINQSIFISGVIDSVPITQWNQTHFQFLMNEFDQQAVSARIILSETFSHAFQVGQKWRLKVILNNHQKRHFKNGFDYDNWLFLHGIRAVGMIQMDKQNHLFGFSQYDKISNIREKIHDCILRTISNHSIASFISAISVGLRGDMKPSDWKIYQHTGTNHLIAIAGLHIGFVATAIYSLIYYCWRLFPRLLLRIPAARVAHIASLMIALSYALLSGLALPAQRASMMMLILIGANWFYRRISVYERLWIAFFLVVLYDPVELFSASLWLSFIAVSLLSFSYFGRLQQPAHWKSLLETQIILSIGLLPMTIWFFQQISVLSVLCNLIAIPWVGFIVLPLTCLGSFFYLCNALILSKFLFWLSGLCLFPLWHILKKIAFLPHANYHCLIPHVGILILCLFGIFIALLPRRFPAKWLGLTGFLPIIFYHMIQ